VKVEAIYRSAFKVFILQVNAVKKGHFLKALIYALRVLKPKQPLLYNKIEAKMPLLCDKILGKLPLLIAKRSIISS
jgi:hypothetical protein